MNGEEHITEERLRKLASDKHEQLSEDEDAHSENCEQCLRRFIELLKEMAADILADAKQIEHSKRR